MMRGDKICFAQAKKISKRRGAIFVPIKLIISHEENIRRVAYAERAKHYKSTSIEKSKLKRKLIEISHENLLELDVTSLAAAEAAKQILQHVYNSIRNKR